MRKVINLIRKYFKEHFSFAYFIPIVIFTGLLIAVEYYFDLEQNFIDYEANTTKRLLNYCLMYFVAFGGAYLLYLFSKKDRALLSNPKLWVMIAFAAILFSVRTWFYQYHHFTEAYIPSEFQTVAKKYFINLQGFVFLFIPIAIYWKIQDARNQPLYGFHYKGVTLKPYFILLLLMVPLVVGAATQADFLQTYPRAYHLYLPAGRSINTVLTAFYEVCYAADFVTTEFFFRGFLILAFARYVGPKSILPMCVFYVTIHFGKPLGETISSFFGGWILGILAYETKSIYGGVIVHLGIALLMEVVAMIAHSM